MRQVRGTGVGHCDASLGLAGHPLGKRQTALYETPAAAYGMHKTTWPGLFVREDGLTVRGMSLYTCVYSSRQCSDDVQRMTTRPI